MDDKDKPEANTAEATKIPVDENGSSHTEESNVPKEAAVAAAIGDEKEELDPPQEAPVDGTETVPPRQSRIRRWWLGYWHHKKWSLPLTVLILLAAILAVPTTRYPLLGLFLKEPYNLTVTDSISKTPVSKADVILGGTTSVTDANGKVKLKVPVGHRKLIISKQYYQTLTANVLVSPLKSHDQSAISLLATGRQVTVSLVNLITNKAVAGATIEVASTDAKTDQTGKATIVLPADATTEKATISATGYNTATANVQVTTTVVPANTIKLTPIGKVYFLSKLSGKIDVVKTNLDGTERQTVLAGTGNESDTDTVLLASRDWKYLALLTQRKPNLPELDLIDTSSDTLSNIDQGNANFTLVGWDNARFVYRVDRTNLQNWQPNQQVLKSFDATSKTLSLLDQTSGSTGSSSTDSLSEQFGTVFILNNEISYILNWYATGSHASDLQSKQATLNSVQADGTNKHVIKGFGLASGSPHFAIAVNAETYNSPSTLLLFFNDGNGDNFYEYSTGKVTNEAGISSQAFFGNSYPTYLLSPSGSHTFWLEPRDGKNTLFIGDQNGANKNQIASLSEYDTYGWYTDNYLFVSKSGSELYVMPVDGSTSPLKITDYHKPAQNFAGYGGGYGGR